ncbi:hypothetical protein AB0B50_16310 [Streptomyces sp. NPDC041068]|uniref:hypothetical protein n=1 Tax=Streptomyces sp. NPDC041068 TaxID=3155130 RepID=UPI0033D1C2D2
MTDTQLNHRDGGIPAVPLMVNSANVAVGALAAIALTIGAPVALAVVGLLAAGMAAKAAQKDAPPQAKPKPAPRRPAQPPAKPVPKPVPKPAPPAPKPAPKAAPKPTPKSVQRPAPPAPKAAPKPVQKQTPKAAPKSAPKPSPTGGGRPTPKAAPKAPQKPAQKPQGGSTGKPSTPKGAERKGSLPGAGKIAAVRALRKQKAAEAPTRSARRDGLTAARRNARDADRNQKRQAPRQAPGRGQAGGKPRTGQDRPKAGQDKPGAGIYRPGGGAWKGPGGQGRRPAGQRPGGQGRRPASGAGRTRPDATRRDRIRDRARAAQDARRGARRERATEQRRTRPARREMRRELRRANRRCRGGRVVTRALRRVRLHRLADRLADRLRDRRAKRRAAARARYDDATRPERQVKDKVQRAPRTAPVIIPRTSTPKGGPTMGQGNSGPSTFSFKDHAEDMENDARAYDPNGALDVLAFLEELPEALQSVAEVFRILAEKSDSEMPFDPKVGESLNEIHGSLTSAVDKAEDAFKTFRQVQEADIDRHENPRNGPQSEAKWDIGNNE